MNLFSVKDLKQNDSIYLEPERYANKAFLMLVEDADAGHKNWVSKARDLASLYEIQSSDTKSIIKHKVQRHFQSEIMNNLTIHIAQDKKLRTYALFKTAFKFETYLDIFTDFTTRSTFAKLRTSAHKLQIEIGRYGTKKTPREERYCFYCKKRDLCKLEDEVHFLTECPLFVEIRKDMLSNITGKFPSVELLHGKNLLIWLLSQEDKFCLELVGKFCRTAFNLRGKALQKK